MMRRLSCIPETFNLVSPHRGSINRDIAFSEVDRRTSQQEIACNAALQFLQERRKSSDSNCILGAIDETMYRKRGSIVNVRGSKDSLCVGRAQLQLSYDFRKSDFVLTLLEATFETKLDECLLSFTLGSDRRKESQRLYPDVAIQLQTFKFPISYEALLDQTLTVELISPKQSGLGFQRHGRSVMPLSALCPFDELLIWTELDSVTDDKDTFGDLRVCLQFLPSAERLSLNVHEIENLRRLETGQRDAGGYVKANLIAADGKIIKKRKSNVRKGVTSNSIIWNEALTFDVDPRTILRCKLEVVVMICDKYGNHQPIGQVVFGNPNVLGLTARIWKDALDGRTGITHSVPLDELTTS
ncbi:C2 domain-containing protein [Aphelenchoides besseyi]|nr:C2 domain-containing protein [Aphelenchoides besseyi]KAI6228075.1 C2 domain-containing protein [Aphelenchoides besseyi]